ncbi:MAG: hypothetical protein CMO81_05035 [Waddliaceae bacterium]|nr:hypothetical protein [Waddliaceae bacterium]
MVQEDENSKSRSFNKKSEDSSPKKRRRVREASSNRDFKRLLKQGAKMAAIGSKIRARIEDSLKKAGVDRTEIQRNMNDPSLHTAETWKMIQGTKGYWEERLAQSRKTTVKNKEKVDERRETKKKNKRLKGKGIGGRRGWLRMD